jgi:trehalose 6-phosphate synthase
MTARPFERVVVAAEGPVDERTGPVLRDHVGSLLQHEAAASDGAWLENPPGSRAGLQFLAVLERALHGQLTRPVTDEVSWEAFTQASRDVVAEILEVLDERRTLVYLRGAAMLLVPAMLRERRPELTITLRLPTPWPAPELFARLPWRTQLLEGATGADVISLSAERDRKNLARSFGRYLDVGVAARKGTVMLADGRRLRTIANPPGIDVAETRAVAGVDAVGDETALWRRWLGTRSLVLAVERLHASSGLLEQLTAIERLLADRGDLAEQLAFVVVATEDPGTSTRVRRDIESTIGRINGRFTQPGGDVPVQYLHGGVAPHTLAALYQLATVLVATPLVAAASVAVKEYVTLQHALEGDGRVLMSETSGTAALLSQVRTCNPFDLDSIAAGIVASWEAEPVQARRSLSAMATKVRRRDVHEWWKRELAFAADPKVEFPGAPG